MNIYGKFPFNLWKDTAKKKEYGDAFHCLDYLTWKILYLPSALFESIQSKMEGHILKLYCMCLPYQLSSKRLNRQEKK